MRLYEVAKPKPTNLACLCVDLYLVFKSLLWVTNCVCTALSVIIADILLFDLTKPVELKVLTKVSKELTFNFSNQNAANPTYAVEDADQFNW